MGQSDIARARRRRIKSETGTSNFVRIVQGEIARETREFEKRSAEHHQAISRRSSLSHLRRRSTAYYVAFTHVRHALRHCAYVIAHDNIYLYHVNNFRCVWYSGVSYTRISALLARKPQKRNHQCDVRDLFVFFFWPMHFWVEPKKFEPHRFHW